ncbi:hypothetical protein FLAG1_04157 [Fusarium langsethiae]|uniref:Uncharacterized protein n=1 Tax=Fusarium langsethiae TaxID=179993 RepID=A0A0N0DFQ7_FUSLA|nr:hypothetical protein FLAG1_04157 [Fusarium langsethiae]GKU01931.1 unnamed protein product [Fusarium langsethiae]GKU16880.1 unnamed protein product [Fusarium langsethiae]
MASKGEAQGSDANIKTALESNTAVSQRDANNSGGATATPNTGSGKECAVCNGRTCGLCKAKGHAMAHCLMAKDGDIPGCVLCNTIGHELDACSRPPSSEDSGPLVHYDACMALNQRDNGRYIRELRLAFDENGHDRSMLPKDQLVEDAVGVWRHFWMPGNYAFPQRLVEMGFPRPLDAAAQTFKPGESGHVTNEQQAQVEKERGPKVPEFEIDNESN